MAAAQRVSEYQVKAAFLYNFSKFLDWPTDSFSNPSDPFVVGIYGADPFGNYLVETISGEKALGRPMIIQRFTDLNETRKCQILFINVPGKTSEAIEAVKGSGVLTVSDDPAFCALGGIIGFYTENATIRLQINMNAAKEANLAISSKLLRISKICE
jgi:hypothetical protein